MGSAHGEGEARIGRGGRRGAGGGLPIGPTFSRQRPVLRRRPLAANPRPTTVTEKYDGTRCRYRPTSALGTRGVGTRMAETSAFSVAEYASAFWPFLIGASLDFLRSRSYSLSDGLRGLWREEHQGSGVYGPRR
jgi:hypothetical protein